MRTQSLALAAFVVSLTACGTSATTDVTGSTQQQSPSSSTPVTSTTTTLASTTTTTPSTTVPATTTSSVIEGNWAEQPLIAYGAWGGIALGWWDGTTWVQVDANTALPVQGGETYQVALLGSTAIVEGGSQHRRGCEVSPEPLPGVQFDDGNALHRIVDDGSGGERFLFGVAISAPWDLTPRSVADGESHPDLETIAVDLLEERGFVADDANIVQVVDADLDGDGTIETLVVAEETELANEMSDVYSVLFAVSPSWDEPAVIADSVIPADDSGFPATYRVSAVADFSGDGKMELVVDGQAWENGSVTVYELTESGFEDRIGAGCGV